MERYCNITTGVDRFLPPVEAVIEKVYKVNGKVRQEMYSKELIITDSDCSVIDVDIIIEIPEIL